EAGEGQRERERHEEALAAREAGGRADLVAEVAVAHLELEVLALDALEAIARREVGEVSVGALEQGLEREALGEDAQLLAVVRADHLPERLPGARARGLRVDERAQAVDLAPGAVVRAALRLD